MIMQYFFKINRLLLLLLWTLVISGCVTEEIKPKIKTYPPAGSGNFPKLSNYRLVLYPVGNRNFATGRTAELNLCLKNVGNKKVNIAEWHMNTPDNIKIYYHPYDKTIETFEPANWQCLTPKIKSNAYRFHLSLHPGNSVFLTKTLPLKEMLKVNAPEGKYLVVSELNLKSVSLRSPMFEISIK